ncbi:response regulator transcription factor [bacterium]|nr:response regulator transcription factor [bacterium]
MKNGELERTTQTSPTSVIHGDPQLLLRFGVKLLLTSKANCTYIGEYDSAEQLKAQLVEKKPDLLLLELALRDSSGIEVIRYIRKEQLPMKVCILSGFEGEATVRQALHAGADGYLFKSCSPEQLIQGIQTVISGERIALPSELNHLQEQELREYRRKGARKGFPLDPLSSLSKREREVFYLLAEGHPNRTIAKQLFISPRTVETHRARVIRKLGFDNTADLVRYAIRNDLMSL